MPSRILRFKTAVALQSSRWATSWSGCFPSNASSAGVHSGLRNRIPNFRRRIWIPLTPRPSFRPNCSSGIVPSNRSSSGVQFRPTLNKNAVPKLWRLSAAALRLRPVWRATSRSGIFPSNASSHDSQSREPRKRRPWRRWGVALRLPTRCAWSKYGHAGWISRAGRARGCP